MKIDIEGLTEFALVRMLNCFPSSVLCLEIEGSPCFLVAPKLKKLKETTQKHSYPCFSVSALDFEALDRAFTYYGYTVI